MFSWSADRIRGRPHVRWLSSAGSDVTSAELSVRSYEATVKSGSSFSDDVFTARLSEDGEVVLEITLSGRRSV